MKTEQKSIEALSLEANKLCFDTRRKYLTPQMESGYNFALFYFYHVSIGSFLVNSSVYSSPIQSSVPPDLWLCSKARDLPFFGTTRAPEICTTLMLPWMDYSMVHLTVSLVNTAHLTNQIISFLGTRPELLLSWCSKPCTIPHSWMKYNE